MSQQKRNNSVQRFNKKLKKSIQQLVKQFKTLLQTQGKWLLRCLLIIKKIPQISLSSIKNIGNQLKQVLGKLVFSPPKTSLYQSKGFILPTIAIVVLVFALVVGSIIFRSANRTEQVANERQKQIADTATTPAVQRAKAKLAFLFKDQNYPNGLASGVQLEELLANTSYDLNGEKRIDIDGDGTEDNAWKFEQDVDGDGKPETIAYSILTRSELRDPNNPKTILLDVTSLDEDKADNLIVRNGPISLKESSNGCESTVNSQGGWYPNSGSSSNFLRAFQVNAVAIKDDDGDRAYTALQFQQDRESDLGNKWGAWFLNDLEIFPGPDFRWNGAIHTEGNFIIGNKKVRGYLISAPQSCLYSRSNSEVTLAEFDGKNIDGSTKPDPTEDNGGRAFQAQVISGRSVSNKANDTNRDKSQWDIFASTPIIGQDRNKLNANNDSINNTSNIAPRLIDPVLLFTEGLKQSRGNTSTIAIRPNQDPENINTTQANTDNVNNNWLDRDLVKEGRIFSNPEKPPFVDDFYRADNRYGPKPKYTDAIDFPLNASKDYVRRSGNEIGDQDYKQDTDSENDDNPTSLTNIKLDEENFDNFGLDGYWERRAWGEGLRIIVGQRLELGNAYGWGNSQANPVTGKSTNINNVTEQDPLYPPYDATLKVGGNPAACQRFSTDLAYSQNNIDRNRCHEHRQWKTLRDNLAAVQATAVYTNYKDNPGQTTRREFPVACIATTAHPGTSQTIDDSTTFNYYPGTTNVIDTNFLQGEGTNGWEFNPPANFTTEADFANAINSPASPLRKALTNLAYFAGDPDGAFPAKQDTTVENQIHPYPYTMMWGDFSNLRRVIDILDGNYTDTRPDGSIFTPNYSYKTVSLNDSNINDLSIADKTTLQTASCTLGLLAYNLDNIENNSGNLLKEVSDKLADKFDNNAKALPSDDGDSNGARGEYNTEITEDLVKRIELIEQVSRDRLLGFKDSPSSKKLSLPQAQIAAIFDDTTDKQKYTVSNKIPASTPFKYGNQDYKEGDPLDLGFDFSKETGNNYFGLGEPDSREKEEQFIRLALLLRDIIQDETVNTPVNQPDNPNDVTKPKYPALYYLFPKQQHDEDGTNFTADLYKDGQDKQFNGSDLYEEYIVNLELPGANKIRQNSGADYQYQPINSDLNNFSAVKIDPRTPTPVNSWEFQCDVKVIAGPGSCDNDSKVQNKIIVPGGQSKYIALLDKGIFNGREQMSVRTLDVDLDILRHNVGPDMKENWLPDSGIVYAFREDTMREDGIERPRQTDFTSCNTLEEITNVNLTANGEFGSNDCVMDAVGSFNNKQQDPPIEDKKFISSKPIDIYPDPDRRPYGFRLRNGRDLRRCHIDLGNGKGETVLRGLSFITDSPTYVQADQKGFNLHIAKDADCDNSTYADSKRIEEFKTKLTTNFKNFYSRGNSGIDDRFARDGDIWRPTTILADSVNILSNKFFDGSIADAIVQPSYNTGNYPYPRIYFNKANTTRAKDIPGCTSGKCTSYFNLKYPRWENNNDQVLELIRENGRSSAAGNNNNAKLDAVDPTRNSPNPAAESPIKISRNGYVIYNDSSGNPQEFGNESPNSGNYDNFRSFEDSNKIIVPDSGNRVNAVIISGLIPSRATQSYGGLHNFPRFNESWSKKDLFISGSLLQLNFSTSGTAPFDQDSWEPSHRPSGSKENIKYYGAPNRRWGYDVGLQIAPAGPVEQRFVTNSGNYSEFFQELPADDAYIINLRCGKDNNGDLVDPNIDTNQCPS